MRIVFLTIATCLVWPSSQRALAADVPASNVQQFAARLESLRRETKIPAFAAAIARDEQVVWARGFGLSDIESRTAATPETCFHLASLTKTFAVTIILQLVEEGKIDLDAPVATYGVDLPAEKPVRIVHLLSHTSSGTPGEQFKYDGNRFALLTQIAEAASGNSFGELLDERIIKKLKLKHTAPNVLDPVNFALAHVDRTWFESRLAAPYELQPDGRFKRIAYLHDFNCSTGLISNVFDVARFSIALDRGVLLSPESWTRATTRTVLSDGRQAPYGLGWFVYEREGIKYVWHYGLWVGDSALLIKVPERKLTYVVLANSERLTSSFFHGQGELMISPFARAFIQAFVTGQGELPDEPVPE